MVYPGRCPSCSRPLPVHGRCYWCARVSKVREASGSAVSELWEFVRSHALPEETRASRAEVAGRAGLFLLLVGLTWSWSMQPLDGSSRLSPSIFQTVLSMANLVFHEAGHILFMIFGRFMTSVGGSLLQVLIPLTCGAAFLFRHANPFGAATCLWWAGQNFVDIAPYINDARAQSLILLGGVTGRDVPGYHDWNSILMSTGLLKYDHTLARLAHVTGAGLMVLALVWAATLVLHQARGLR